MSNLKIGIEKISMTPTEDDFELGHAYEGTLYRNVYNVWKFKIFLADENLVRVLPNLNPAGLNVFFLKYQPDRNHDLQVSPQSLDPNIRNPNNLLPLLVSLDHIPLFPFNVLTLTISQLISSKVLYSVGDLIPEWPSGTFPADWIEIDINCTAGSGKGLFYLQ